MNIMQTVERVYNYNIDIVNGWFSWVTGIDFILLSTTKKISVRKEQNVEKSKIAYNVTFEAGPIWPIYVIHVVQYRYNNYLI